ncbi:MAG: hypothetical protein ACRYFV_23890 [Janthinobacterium lividum]
MENWFIESLRHILTALATSAVLYVLLRQSKRVPDRDVAGSVVLRQQPFYRMLGLVSASVGLVMLVGTLLSVDWALLRYDVHEQIGFGFAMLGALLFIGLSVPVLQASAKSFTITSLGIASSGPRGQYTFLLWHDITTVRYNTFTHELKISTPQFSIKAGRYLVGFDLLLAELTHRLRLTPTQMGLPK